VILSQDPTGMFDNDIRMIQVQSGFGTAKHGSGMIFVGVTYPDKVPCDRLINPEFLSLVRLLELCHEYLFFEYRARELIFFRIQIQSWMSSRIRVPEPISRPVYTFIFFINISSRL